MDHQPAGRGQTKAANLTALEREWDAKLADSGFVDLERRKGGGRHDPYMKLPEGMRRGFDQDTADAYEAFRALLHEPDVFTDDDERRIWELYCEGSSELEISRTLGISRNRKVRATIEILTRRASMWGDDKRDVLASLWYEFTHRPKRHRMTRTERRAIERRAIRDSVKRLATAAEATAPRPKMGRIREIYWQRACE